MPSWDRVNQFLSIGANLSVLVGLVFVGLEVQNGNSAVQTQTSALVVEGFNTLNALVISDSELARIVSTADNEPEKVSGIEAMQYSHLLRSYANQYVQLYRMYENGQLGEDEWQIYASEAQQMLASPGGKLFLEGNSIAIELNSIISELESLPRAYDDFLGRGYQSL
jgi:hypothetical protein